MASGARFCFANTHTDHVSAEAREKGMGLILDRMETFSEGLPSVLTGDHNCQETDPPALAVSKRMANAIHVCKAEPSGPWCTLNLFRDAWNKIPAAEVLRLPPEKRRVRGAPRIDFIYVTPGTEVLSYRTIGDKRKGLALYPSDHMPVSADIVLPSRPAAPALHDCPPQEGAQHTIRFGKTRIAMKWCPPGTFVMGSPEREEGRSRAETPHRVTISKGFWMGETEVTQGQWKALMGGETVLDLVRKGLQDDTIYDLPGGRKTLRAHWKMTKQSDPGGRCGDVDDDIPVYNVSWNEAAEFCRRLTMAERAAGRLPAGYEYRLPTEAEWEYACRAGGSGSLPDGAEMRILGRYNAPAIDAIAWYGGNSSRGFCEGRGVDTSKWPGKQYPGGRAFARKAKGRKPNGWGLYDMLGNVWEWRASCSPPTPSRPWQAT